MFVSTNRTPVQLLAVETIQGSESTDLTLDAMLLGLESRELRLSL
jgi:hypothetical protein